MNTKDDPDAQTGEWKKAHDNALRFNTSLDWLLNKSWITNVAVTASVNYADMLSKYHLPVHTASEQPAVNATTEGYFVANQLPVNYVNTQFIDSKELDYGISLKANWSRRFDRLLNRVKAGVTWSSMSVRASIMKIRSCSRTVSVPGRIRTFRICITWRFTSKTT